MLRIQVAIHSVELFTSSAERFLDFLLVANPAKTVKTQLTRINAPIIQN